jgi:23S rRNA pseudouridine1911/1915/1917 synthase
MNATRTRVQKAIDAGLVKINGVVVKASRKIQGDDHIVCTIMKSPPIELIPQNIPIKVVYEDEYFLVVDKPAGMCTHPGVGNRYGTLVNALIYYMGVREAISIEIDEEDEENQGVIFASEDVRPGIVHRLDKDTSGLLVIAKDPMIHVKLQQQFADRSISREYYAIIWGNLKSMEARIEGDIGRSPRDRKKFAVVKKGGKHAITDYWVIENFKYNSLIKLKLQTGRTHQIRVHLSNTNNPVLGDVTYGGDSIIYGMNNPIFKSTANQILHNINRQLLHAKNLTLRHPITNQVMTFESELPDDFVMALEFIKKYQEKVNTNL